MLNRLVYKLLNLVFLILIIPIFDNDAIGKNVSIVDEETPSQDYYRAMYYYANSSPHNALAEFQKIDTKYPVLNFSREVKIMIIYSQYLDREYSDAINSIDAFVSFYPRTRYDDYLAYLRALCTYRQITGISKSYEMKLKAVAEMSSVVERFPGSEYAKEAQKIVDYLNMLLIYNNFLVGDFYYKDRSYFAAINRYLKVITQEKFYSVNNLTPIAYFRIATCYYNLGLIDMHDYYKDLFNSSIKNLNGNLSFHIEGSITYESPKDKEEKQKKALEKILKKEKRNRIKEEKKRQKREKRNKIIEEKKKENTSNT